MGVMGAEADDAESEFIRSVCEKVRGRICRVGRLSGVSGRGKRRDMQSRS